MITIIHIKSQNDRLNPFELYIWQKYRQKYEIKNFLIFFLQNWNFSIFQVFTFLTVKSKVIEIHKCAIPKNNHWNHLNLICFTLFVILRTGNRLELTVFESHFLCITLQLSRGLKIWQFLSICYDIMLQKGDAASYSTVAQRGIQLIFHICDLMASWDSFGHN